MARLPSRWPRGSIHLCSANAENLRTSPGGNDQTDLQREIFTRRREAEVRSTLSHDHGLVRRADRHLSSVWFVVEKSMRRCPVRAFGQRRGIVRSHIQTEPPC